MSALPGLMPGPDVGAGLVQSRPIRFAAVATYEGFEVSPSSSPVRLLIMTALLDGEQIPLSRPVQLGLSREAGSWVAENDTLGLFGDGPSQHEAISSFIEHFEHFLAYYTRLSWDEVAGDGARLKGVYDDLAGSHAPQNR